MTYVKNTWSENDIITAEKLNNIENGVSNSSNPFVIEVTQEEAETARTEEGLTKTITEEEFLKAINSNTVSIKSDATNYVLYKNTFVEDENFLTAIFFNTIMSSTMEITFGKEAQNTCLYLLKIST